MHTQLLQTTVVHTQQVVQSHLLQLKAVSIHLSDMVHNMGSEHTHTHTHTHTQTHHTDTLAMSTNPTMLVGSD